MSKVLAPAQQGRRKRWHELTPQQQQDYRMRKDLCDPPNDMPLYEVRDFLELFETRELPESMMVTRPTGDVQ